MKSTERAFDPQAVAWAEQQWGSVDLGDQRLNRRAVGIGQQLALSPSMSLPQQIRDRAPLKATYRLLANKAVTHERLSTPHWQATRQQAGQQPLVLLVQDITEIDCTRYAETMAHLGPIGDGRGRGLLLHSTLAVLPAPRQVLGLVHQQSFHRVAIPEGTSRHRRPKDERESRVWGQAVKAVGAPPTGSRWVVVADRAGDHTHFLLTCRREGVDFLVRLSYEHRLVTEDNKPAYLLTTAREWPARLCKTLTLRERGGRPAREVRLLLSYGQVTIRTPKKEQPLSLSVVRVWEEEPPPPGEAPIEWFLGSSLPVESGEQALERSDWYTSRWLVETYHQCLKTGCGIETRDLEEAERLERLLGFLAVVAVRLLQLQEASRLEPERLAEQVVEPLRVRLLAAQQRKQAATMTLGEFWRGVAQLGGFLGRQRDGPPGWKTLWRGWLLLDTWLQGAHLASSLPDPECG